MKAKNHTLTQCDECGGELAFRQYGMVDTEGIWHSDYPDWYRCLKCGSWNLAYTERKEEELKEKK